MLGAVVSIQMHLHAMRIGSERTQSDAQHTNANSHLESVSVAYSSGERGVSFAGRSATCCFIAATNDCARTQPVVAIQLETQRARTCAASQRLQQRIIFPWNDCEQVLSHIEQVLHRETAVR